VVHWSRSSQWRLRWRLTRGSGRQAPAYAAPPVSDWTGFYVGGHAGYGWGHDPLNNSLFGQQGSTGPSSVVSNIPPVNLSGIDSKGFVGGGHFGYNQQWGNWVGGLEIDISSTGIKGSTANTSSGSITLSVPPVVQPVTNAASQSDSFDLLGTARGRLGVLAWPNMLFYGTGGLAWTRFTTNTAQTQTLGATAVVVANSFTSVAQVPTSMFGWVAGVGGEAKIYNSNWLLRVEYLHYDFGDRVSSANVSTIGASTSSTVLNNGHLTADVVRAGISYKFGGPIY
jgi:outer membrane immunogenic protein